MGAVTPAGQPQEGRFPVPVGAADVEGLTTALREARAWAGNPSFATLTRGVRHLRLRRGVPASEAAPGRVTVYDCFRSGRRRLDVDLVLDLVAVLGADTHSSAAWRSAVRRVLVGDQGTPAEVVVAPRPPRRLVGRGPELAAVRRARGCVRIEGMPGVGKTALAVRAADDVARAAGWDAPLLVDLRGHSGPGGAVDPETVARALLPHLVPRRPEGASGSTEELRQVLAGSEVVLVLDNAADADQVLPLLPPEPAASRVVVTSRWHLAGLPGEQVVLTGLPEAESVELLGHLAGGVIADGAAEARELARHVEGHPLALSLIGARMATHSDWPLVEHLTAYRARRDLLQLDERVQSCLLLSYRALEPLDRRLLRALSWSPAPALTAVGTEALAEVLDAPVREGVRRLAEAHLLRSREPGTWQLHDLVRTFAAARSLEEDPPSLRDQGARSVARTYLRHAVPALAALHAQAAADWTWAGQPPLAEAEAQAWLARERDNLRACASWASRAGEPELLTRWAAVLAPDLWQRGDADGTVELQRAAVAAAPAVPDPLVEAVAQRDLGNSLLRAGRYREAEPHLRRAHVVFKEQGHAAGQLSVLTSRAILASAVGDQEDAARVLGEIIEQLRSGPPTERLAVALRNLAVTLARSGRTDRAVAALQESVELATEHGWAERERVGLSNLSGLLAEAGRHEEAQDAAARALELAQQAEDWVTAAYARSNLGLTHAADDPGRARDHLLEALAQARRLEVVELEASVLNHLGDHARRAGREEESRERHEQALQLARSIGEANEEDRALLALADLGQTPEEDGCARVDR